MARARAHFPGQPPIDAYGNGGFRFADMSHRGSLHFLPSGVTEWQARFADGLEVADFAVVFNESSALELLLLGCGAEIVLPSKALRQAFTDHGIGLDPMSTGAAARTYNILLAEGRRVGASLIAVD